MQTQQKRFLITLLLLLPALVHLFPLGYALALAFKTKEEVFLYPPQLLPNQLLWENFSMALQTAPLARFLVNSLVMATSITLLQIVTSVLAAYALSRLEFGGRKISLAIIIGTMMIPGEITIIPNYLTVASLGWIDTYKGLILPFAASGFGVFMLYQFMRTIPKELEEAAFLDGASKLRFLFQFVIPVSLPAITAFGIYSFVNAWNMYLWPLIATQSTSMQTAQIGLGMVRSQNESISWGMVMAATVILVSPTLILFIFTQKQFLRGMVSSGIKG